MAGSKARPASIRLDNTFGATRVWPDIVPDLPPLLGRAMLEDAGAAPWRFEGYEGGLDCRRPKFVDAPLFASLQIDLFADPDPDVLPFLAEQIADKYVLIGGDIVDYDRVETTFTSINGEVPAGIAVHAEIIAQMLDNRYLNPIPPWMLWAMAVLVVLSAALTALLEWPARRLAPFLVALAVGFIGIPVLLQLANVDTYGNETLKGEGEILLNATTFRFDGSDLMPGAVGAGSFWTGMVDFVGGASAQEVGDQIQSSWDAIK
jgi:adenylate cyclase